MSCRGCLLAAGCTLGVLLAVSFLGLLLTSGHTESSPAAQERSSEEVHSPIEPKKTRVQEQSDGCDHQERGKALDYALKQALPPDPFDEPTEPQHWDESTFLLPDASGEPKLIKDAGLAVCVYVDQDVGVYTSTALFSSRMLAMLGGKRNDTFLGMPLPTSNFQGLTYWSFKGPRGPEFSMFVFGIENPEDVRYEVRQGLFDIDRKLALFTQNVFLDRNGRLIGQIPDHQRIELQDGEHPVTLRAVESLGHLINDSDRRFQMALDALRH